MYKPVILASQSPIRKTLLAGAGIEFATDSARIDERAVESALAGSGATPADLAEVLAVAKAEETSLRHPGALVIGCDQTLSLGDEVLHKCPDMEAARRRLLQLSGKTHELNSAVAIAVDGDAVWRQTVIARMTMRSLSPAFIGRHLDAAGEKALGSVGAYQIEGEGINLFEAIDGDFFTIAGLPLLPLLAELRRLGAIDG
ncbi:MAG: Maf-like protein [Phyllobacteriaceae bacterium]|nr:Maf-like protein [Phyllobacteriaceae bacterium]